MRMRVLQRARRVAAAAGLVLAALAANASAGDLSTSNSENIAIKGYDPVSYFTDRKAVRGSDAHSYRWLGATWLFANDEHRRLFVATPASYAPQYGGACAEAMATSGEAVLNIDPESWQIIDGKLYLSADARFQDRALDVAAADRNWQMVRDRMGR